jgi:hypothetical protein
MLIVLIVILAICGLLVSKETALHRHLFKIRSGVGIFATVALLLLGGLFLALLFSGEETMVFGVAASIAIGLALLFSARFWVPKTRQPPSK